MKVVFKNLIVNADIIYYKFMNIFLNIYTGINQ